MQKSSVNPVDRKSRSSSWIQKSITSPEIHHESQTTNYPSVTLTRVFFATWVGIPRGFLWTRNCVVTFGLAIAGFSLDSQLHGYFGLAIAWFPVDSQCWFYIPGCIFLVLYSWLCIPGFIFQVSYYWFYIPGFIFQDWECFGGLGLASRPRTVQMISELRFLISDFRF